MIKTSLRRCAAGCVLTLAVGVLGPLRSLACLNDSDCNDGLFCTTDHCIFFFCSHSARDCGDSNDCTRDSCDEARNVCVHEELRLTTCEDFNIFTTDEVCCGGTCTGLPILPVPVVLGDRCCVSADCPSDQICLNTICVLDVSLPTPTPTQTPTRSRTPTPTRTPTPDDRPALTISDVAGLEGNSGFRNFIFTATLSKKIGQEVLFHFTTANGSAVAGSDYFAGSGTVTIPRDTLSVMLPAIPVLGDLIPEADERFFVLVNAVSNNARLVAQTPGHGIIVNDDTIPFLIPGIGALSPQDSVAEIGQHIPLTLTWTSPQSWHDLSTVDLRLRGQRGVALWLRFDETAGTIGLIHPSDVSLGPAFAPGSPEELAGESVAVVLGESAVQASGPDAPTVEITFTLRFDTAAAGYTYLVDATAADDAGDRHDFDTVGTVSVAAPLSCPGDCSHDGTVSVDELVMGVSIALGAADVSNCPDFDIDGSGTVEVNEIVAAINGALEGCP